ncbi:MAG: hypothetical protein AAGA67_07720 [Cyanobacteria bacterium P01_F01_bin.153]
MKLLPFKKLPAKADSYTVGDSTIGEIELPKFGVLTLGEWVQYFDGNANIEANKDLSKDQKLVKRRVLEATLMLQRLDPTWTEKDTSAVWVVKDSPSGEHRVTPSEKLIKALADFFDKEFNQWAPSGYAFMVENQVIPKAREMAIARAKEDGLVVVTRSDLQSKGIFLGYRRQYVPQNVTGQTLLKWIVVDDFAPPAEFGDEEGDGEKK